MKPRAYPADISTFNASHLRVQRTQAEAGEYGPEGVNTRPTSAEEDPSTLVKKQRPMNEATHPPALPDRLSVDPRSPHHIAAVFEHEIGIRLNDKERFDVEEYCISEGWVKVPAGRALDRRGQPMLIKLKGKVEAFYR